MSDDNTLRKKAREAIQAGRLPGRLPEHVWGGTSTGASCTVCGEVVAPDELEFELEFAPNGDDASPVNHHLHTRCFAVWESERRELRAAPSSTPEQAAPQPHAAGAASESTPGPRLNGATRLHGSANPNGHHLPSAEEDGTMPRRESGKIQRAGP